jgi:hypothetical protein
MTDFIEQQIISAVRGLLTGRMNEIFSDWNMRCQAPPYTFIGMVAIIVFIFGIVACDDKPKDDNGKTDPETVGCL